MGKKCLIISGGEFSHCPDPKEFDLVIACDKGLDYARRLGVRPDVVVGDFDSKDGGAESVDQALAELYPDGAGIPIVTLPVMKDYSDSYHGILEGMQRGCDEFVICCIMGGRFDHMFANIQMAAFAAKKGARVTLVGDSDVIYIYKDSSMTFPRKEGWSISAFSLSEKCTGVDISGGIWGGAGRTFTFDDPVGLSNEWAQAEPGAESALTYSVENGILMVVESKM